MVIQLLVAVVFVLEYDYIHIFSGVVLPAPLIMINLNVIAISFVGLIIICYGN